MKKFNLVNLALAFAPAALAPSNKEILDTLYYGISNPSGFYNSTTQLMLIAKNSTEMVCNENNEGGIYYDSTTKKHYGCDGTNWNAFY